MINLDWEAAQPDQHSYVVHLRPDNKFVGWEVIHHSGFLIEKMCLVAL